MDMDIHVGKFEEDSYCLVLSKANLKSFGVVFRIFVFYIGKDKFINFHMTPKISYM